MGGGTSGRLLRNPIARRQVDVDFSDLLDHFALDRNTRGDSPLHQSIHDVQKFMSAAPAAARAKPVSWSSPAGMRKAPERRNSYRQNQ